MAQRNPVARRLTVFHGRRTKIKNERLVGTKPRQTHIFARAPPRTKRSSSTMPRTKISAGDRLAIVFLFVFGFKQRSGRMREANETCYAAVRGELQTLFGALCRNKTADLVMAGTKVGIRSWVALAGVVCPSRASDRVATPRPLSPHASSVG